MYTHPFSAWYWRDASRELRDLRKLLFAALMIAMCVVPLFGGAKVTWGFLARSVCAWVCGPVLGLLFAFAEDILSFFLTGGGGYPFFPGYTLTTMLGVLTYALFLYRAPLRIWRIFCAKLLTNVQNVVLGALWMAILNSNGRFSLETWYASASLSAAKNLIMLPVQTVLLVLLLRALQPALQRTGMLPRQGAGQPPQAAGPAASEGRKNVQRSHNICLQFVYIHPLTMEGRGGKLVLALRRKEC